MLLMQLYWYKILNPMSLPLYRKTITDIQQTHKKSSIKTNLLGEISQT